MRILGEIKSFNNKRSITAASVAVIEDHNEYLFHQLEVIQAHLALLKGGSVRLTCLTHIQTSKVPASSVEASAYNDAALNSADPMATDLSHLTPLQRKIYQAIAAEAPDWPEGVDIQQVFQRCKNTDPAQVQYVQTTFSRAGMPLMSLPTMVTFTKLVTRRTTLPRLDNWHIFDRLTTLDIYGRIVQTHSICEAAQGSFECMHIWGIANHVQKATIYSKKRTSPRFGSLYGQRKHKIHTNQRVQLS